MKKQNVLTRGCRLRVISIGSLWCFWVTVINIVPGVSWAQHAHPRGQNTAPGVGAAAINFDLRTTENPSVWKPFAANRWS